MAYLSQNILLSLGFKNLGENVKISERAVFYNYDMIEIGDNSRIDDFCIVSAGSGGVKIGRYVHVAPYCSLIGQGAIIMEDFCGLSSKVSIYSSTDDYSGAYMTNPCVDKKYTNVKSGSVILRKHSIVGVGSVIMPNVEIKKCSAVGAMSLVTKNVEENTIVMGVPAKKILNRKNLLLKHEENFMKSGSSQNSVENRE